VSDTEPQRLLEKAVRAAGAARMLLAAGDADFAASRAYYAMFYVAEALLAQRGLHYRKHGGVHAAVGEHLVKARLLDQKFHRWLIDAFDKRLAGDYGVEAAVVPAEVAITIERAEEFHRAALRLIEAPP
jgi:uncharacterized protein (UPF0332 family)